MTVQEASVELTVKVSAIANESRTDSHHVYMQNTTLNIGNPKYIITYSQILWL